VEPQDYIPVGLFFRWKEKRSGALMSRKKSRNNNSGATLGFEETLWQAADKMRGNLKELGFDV